MQASISISPSPTDCWWNSCLLGRAEWKKRRRKKKKKATKHPYIHSLPLFLSPLPPFSSLLCLPPSHSFRYIHTERELPEICLHILWLRLSPVSPELPQLHRRLHYTQYKGRIAIRLSDQFLTLKAGLFGRLDASLAAHCSLAHDVIHPALPIGRGAEY